MNLHSPEDMKAPCKRGQLGFLRGQLGFFYFGPIGFRVAGLNLQVAMQWLHSGQ